ncbi:hypothetical protein ACGFZP_21795 [Kitasatospora sp. NPDC048239]|uniref:hypothetical protein n=1 Tax=Kitasatospora sp. NPDC048239 TaxID=3364046 RepID=UPI00370FC75C
MELLDVLTELARSGRLGPVATGASWGTVTEALGEPFEVLVEKRRSWPRLFAYGDLELSVCRCRKTILICLQTWRDVVELPAGLVGREAFPGRPEYAEVTGALDRAGCAWQPYEPLTFGTQCSVQAASGVVFTFEIPEGEEPLLNIVSPPPHHHDCPAAAGTGSTPTA